MWSLTVYARAMYSSQRDGGFKQACGMRPLYLADRLEEPAEEILGVTPIWTNLIFGRVRGLVVSLAHWFQLSFSKGRYGCQAFSLAVRAQTNS